MPRRAAARDWTAGPSPAERRKAADGAARHDDEGPLFGFLQPLRRLQEFLDPHGDLEAEGDGHGMAVMSAPRHDRIGMVAGMAAEMTQDIGKQPVKHLLGALGDQQQAGLDDVLRGDAPMDIAAMLRPAEPHEIVDERDQRVPGRAVGLFQPPHVETFVAAVIGDNLGGGRRDHAEFALGERHGLFDIKEGLVERRRREGIPQSPIVVLRREHVVEFSTHLAFSFREERARRKGTASPGRRVYSGRAV